MNLITYHVFQDYDAFDVANEDDELEEFLGIPRKHPKVNSCDDKICNIFEMDKHLHITFCLKN